MFKIIRKNKNETYCSQQKLIIVLSFYYKKLDAKMTASVPQNKHVSTVTVPTHADGYDALEMISAKSTIISLNVNQVRNFYYNKFSNLFQSNWDCVYWS